jgi:ABC-type glycerol-3-phosphate transport system permease component
MASSVSIKRKRRLRIDPQTAVVYALTGVMLLVVLFPIAWVLSSSFKGFEEIYQHARRMIPREPTWTNYVFLFEKLPNFPRQLVNSFIVTGGAVALTALMATMMGYGFARLEFRGRDLLFYTVIVSMFIPRSGGLMAQFELMDFLGLRDSLVGLILAFGAGLPVSMFIMRQSFLYIPRELEDAAAIDGASVLQTFWKVALPMCTSGLVVVCILKFVQVWGDYLFTLTMLDSAEKFTAAVGVAIVRSFVGFRSGVSPDGLEAPIAPLGVLASASIIVMIPVVTLYVSLQKWFVRGLLEGVLKF